MYIATLNTNQKLNISGLITEMEKNGITNPYSQAAILSVISKESTFVPTQEKGYQNTSNSRIRSIFGSRVSGLSDSELTDLKANPRLFFNKIYGGRYGNDDPYTDGNDGYRFRGGGYNQLTFKGNYKKAQQLTGIKLLDNPEKINEPNIAKKVSIAYFINAFRTGFNPALKKAYNSKDLNSFTNLDDAVLAVYHSNAGFGKPVFKTSSKTSTGGLEKALSRSTEFFVLVELKKKEKQ